MTDSAPDPVRVSGGATAEEVAAVLAALRHGAADDRTVPSPYVRWRRTRLRALRNQPAVRR
jgi:hypothetical protein